jgi:DNA-binding transcriptional MocR family regulator
MDKDNAEDSVIRALRVTLAEAGPGDRLPSVRALMDRLRVSPVTVQHAVRRLVAAGVVEVRPGQGTFVATPVAAGKPPDMSWQAVALGPRADGDEALPDLLAVPPLGTIALSGGYLDPALQPVAALGAALSRAARRPAAWGRGRADVPDDLRGWFARQAGGSFQPGDVVVCPGGQAALSTAFRGLTRPGETVLVESPTYLGAIAVARTAGLRVVPVPADTDGVRPDLLADTLARTGSRLFYCQPLYANPHGGTLSTERRAAVLSILAGAGAFVLEDDWARDFTIDGTPPPPLATEDVHGHVIYLRSLAKSAAPGMRIAALAARGAAGARLRTACVRDDLFVSGPLLEAAVDLLSSPAFQRHLRALRPALAARRGAMLAGLREHLPALVPPVVPAGGLHLWVRLPDDTDDRAVTAAAARHGVAVHPGRPWYAADPPAPYLRLTYGSVPPDVVSEGIRRLAEAIHS